MYNNCYTLHRSLKFTKEIGVIYLITDDKFQEFYKCKNILIFKINIIIESIELKYSINHNLD